MTPVALCTWQIATASASAASCGRRWRVEAKQQLHHLLDLMLLRATKPDHRPFDFRWRVLDDRQPCLRGREKGDSARMPELQRAAHVPSVKDVLHRHAIGPMAIEQRRQVRVNVLELVGKCGAGGSRNRSADDQAVTAAQHFDAAVPGALGAGIDPEDLHANEASISFSSMSAFDQTFLLSSCSSSASISLIICWACLPSSFT